MRSAALIGVVALLAARGAYDMAPARGSAPAITVAYDGAPGGSIQLPLGRELEVVLGGNPTTGYTWRHRLDDAARLRLTSHGFRTTATGSPRPLGSGGAEVFSFEATAAGTQQLRFEYRRGTEAPVRTYDLTVIVLP